MSAWAKPGVKCVCINDIPNAGEKRSFTARKGQIYTVRAVNLFTGGIFLTECPQDFSYATSRFRPLVTRTQEQDIAIFTPILDGLPVGESA